MNGDILDVYILFITDTIYINGKIVKIIHGYVCIVFITGYSKVLLHGKGSPL